MHILAAYGGSPYSQFMLDSLGKLPSASEADVSLVMVSAFPAVKEGSAAARASYATQFIGPQRQAEERQLHAVAESIDEHFRSVHPHLLHGSPGVEIVKFGETENVDLIVCGAIGQSALSRVLLGSVSDTIATGATCSTLVIRPPTDSRDHRSSASESTPLLPPPLTPKRVLIGVGNAESDGRLTDWITRMSLSTTTQIDLVYVMERHPEYELDLLRKASAYWSEVRSTAVGHMDQMCADLQAIGYRVNSTLLEAPHVGAALIEQAKKLDCNLIVVGDRRETMMSRILLGSTSRHVLRQAPCSVLIVR